MTLSISKSGAFLNNGNSISFIKGINNVVNFINSTSELNVSMEVENANRFIKIFKQINNSTSVSSELVQVSSELILYKFNFKTI